MNNEEADKIMTHLWPL